MRSSIEIEAPPPVVWRNGRTRLEGSTWYALAIQPPFHWTPIADALVSRIHLRVLRHIKRLSETPQS